MEKLIGFKLNRILAIGVLLQLGCAPNSSHQALDPVAADSSSLNTNTAMIAQKVFVDEAQLEQIKPHKATCGTSEENQICITICHVPPGNPEAAQTKVIALAALKAHLNHGKHGKHKLTERDYLGACGGSSEPVDSAPTDDSESTSNPGTDGTSTTPPGNDGVIPLWCQAYLDVDSNCDGFDDITGEPLL